jgi:hypothetical protein
MKKFLTAMAFLAAITTPALARSFGYNDKTAAHQSGLHSFAMVPRPGWARAPEIDYRRGTSNYPFGPGYNLPYPDRPYGDPDHW